MVATKNFRVDSFVAGLAIKAPCIAFSNANLALSGEQTVNGVAVVEGDRVLVKDQTDGIENGIYNVETSAWARAGDFDGNRDVVRGTLVVIPPTLGQSFLYQVTTADPIVIGTTAIAFELLDSISPQTVKNVITTAYTALVTDDVILVDDDTAGGQVTITLPAVSSITKRLEIKKLGSTASVVVDGNGAETIDEALTATLTVQFESITIVTGEGNWHVL